MPNANYIRRCQAVAALLGLCGLAATASAGSLAAAPDHPDGVYKTGEPARWRITWTGEKRAPQTVSYVVKKGGLAEVGRGTVRLAADGSGTVEATLDQPGALLLEVKATSTSDRVVAGAVFSPDKIAPSAPRPDDFDSFWDEKLRELQAVPIAARATQADAGKGSVIYSKITLDNIRGTKVEGQLARPAEGEKFPALLIVQWAGVYGLEKSWVTDRAAEGWLVLNISPHELPIDRPASFYKDQYAGPLKDYWAIGNDDREASYFLRMYLSCHRGAEFLAQRPDWDGRTLAVMGGSQGGQQALVTAALHPKVSAVLSSVPAGCDMLGPDVGRTGGWPQWYWATAGKDAAKVRSASRYFDVVNFAPRIRCPVLVGVGLIDEVCPPAGILAATNGITAAKEVILMPRGAHQDEAGSHDDYSRRCWGAWLPALRRGEPAPVATK